VIITDKSGIAGIAHWVNSHLGLDADKKIDKRHPGLAKMHKWVMEQYEQGRTTSMSHDELLDKAKKYLPEYFVSDLDKLKKKAQEIALHLVEEMVERKEMRTMDHAKQEAVIQKLLDENTFIQFAYVVNKEGHKTTKNITQIQYKAQYETSGLGDNFSDRSWFISPMKDGKSFVSDFYTSKITGALCITVSAPVADDESNIVGVFGVDIRFEDLVRAE
jgi:citrate (Re)-synthase